MVNGDRIECLIVHSGNVHRMSPFIKEQMDSIARVANVRFSVFTITGSGPSGYAANLPMYYRRLRRNGFDIVHAHYGLSGAFACMQSKVPVLTTFHGSDVNQRKQVMRLLARFAMLRSKHCIFVSHELLCAAGAGYGLVIPCGVDLTIFKPMDRNLAREKMNLNKNKTYVLFSSSFDNVVKNAPLAVRAVGRIGTANDVKLIELRGYSRSEVALLMNAVDVGLMTSRTEGSPQFVKEALACNLPVVSTNVGDVEEQIRGVEGCYVCHSHQADEVADKLTTAIAFGRRTAGRVKVMGLDSRIIAEKVASIYYEVLRDVPQGARVAGTR